MLAISVILALDQEVPKADNGVAGKRSIRVEGYNLEEYHVSETSKGDRSK